MVAVQKASTTSCRSAPVVVSMASERGRASVAAISKSERDRTAPGAMLSRSPSGRSGASFRGSTRFYEGHADRWPRSFLVGRYVSGCRLRYHAGGTAKQGAAFEDGGAEEGQALQQPFASQRVVECH